MPRLPGARGHLQLCADSPRPPPLRVCFRLPDSFWLVFGASFVWSSNHHHGTAPHPSPTRLFVKRLGSI